MTKVARERRTFLAQTFLAQIGSRPEVSFPASNSGVSPPAWPNAFRRSPLIYHLPHLLEENLERLGGGSLQSERMATAARVIGRLNHHLHVDVHVLTLLHALPKIILQISQGGESYCLGGSVGQRGQH